MKSKQKLQLALCASLLLGSASLQAKEPTALESVPALDLNRYQGTWYEISKYPNSFQKKCVGGQTRAEYTLLPDNKVQVVNRCRLADGSMNEGRAIGRQVGGSGSSKLEVSFAPSWLSFLPVVWGNYWVIDLDENYELVAVSEPKREYLWVLSRSKTVDPVAYEKLLSRLKEKGYDLSKLEKTSQ